MSDYLDINRANWDERVPIHLAAPSYDLTPLREGRGRLHPIEAAEIGDVRGLRVLHLQCHFGRDSLTLAQMGAEVVGVDFSAPAIEAGRALAAELALPVRFVLSDVYSTPEKLLEAGSFDRVFVTWGAISWLPDIAAWARVVAHFLRPGGRLYLADGHPFAYVFDDMIAGADGKPGWLMPYFSRDALVLDDERDYADADARLRNTRTHSFNHPICEILGAVQAAGLSLDWLREHATVPWQMFASLVPREGDMYGWPDRDWLPLAFSLSASRA